MINIEHISDSAAAYRCSVCMGKRELIRKECNGVTPSGDRGTVRVIEIYKMGKDVDNLPIGPCDHLHYTGPGIQFQYIHLILYIVLLSIL